MHLVLGATGGVGGAIVRELKRRGLPVRAVVRDPERLREPGVEVVRGDVRHMPDLLAAAKGAEVLYQALGTPMARWDDELRVLHENVVEASGLTGATLVFPQSQHGTKLVYDVPLPPVVADPEPMAALTRTQRMRAEMEQAVELNAELRNVRGLVVRAAELVGAGARSGFAGATLAAWRAGGPLPWYGGAAHAFSLPEDVAYLCVELAQGPAPYEVVNAPSHTVAGPGAWAELLSRVGGRPARVSATPKWMVRARALIDPESRAIAETFGLWEGAVCLDDAGSRARAPGWTPADFEDSLRRWLTTGGAAPG